MKKLDLVMKKRRKTPQDKKIKSYQHDCRDDYWESNKGRRKTIPRRKSQQNRAMRRTTKVQITHATEAFKQEEMQCLRRSKFNWRKDGDRPLADKLKSKAEGQHTDKVRVRKLFNKRKSLTNEAMRRLLNSGRWGRDDGLLR